MKKEKYTWEKFNQDMPENLRFSANDGQSTKEISGTNFLNSEQSTFSTGNSNISENNNQENTSENNQHKATTNFTDEAIDDLAIDQKSTNKNIANTNHSASNNSQIRTTSDKVSAHQLYNKFQDTFAKIKKKYSFVNTFFIDSNFFNRSHILEELNYLSTTFNKPENEIDARTFLETFDKILENILKHIEEKNKKGVKYEAIKKEINELLKFCKKKPISPNIEACSTNIALKQSLLNIFH